MFGMKVKAPVFDRQEVAYIKCVHSDPEFIRRADALKAVVEFKNDNHISAGKDNGKVKMVAGDQYTRELPENIVAAIMRLADDYDLKLSDMLGYLNGFGSMGNRTVTIDLTSRYDDEGPHFRINVSPGATKRDVIGQLRHFDQLMEAAYGNARKKDKGPENFQLVYAIHRERKTRRSFGDIHSDYLGHKLKHYRGASTITSLVKFRQYYNKYKPQVPLK